MKKYLIVVPFMLFLSCGDDPIVDMDPPVIESMFPQTNSVEVSRDVTIQITFDEAIDSTNLINSITLTSMSSTVLGVITYDSDSYRVTFKPNSPLEYLTDYTLNLSGNIKDLNGNNLDPLSWSFRTIAELGPAKYELKFVATWSAETHPVDIPPAPHFSALIGMTHNPDISLFKNGELASLGIKNMAEVGDNRVLIEEINQFIEEGKAQSLLVGGGIPISPDEIKLEFELEIDFSLISLVSMIAPSPDWFISVSNYNLYQEGKWIESTTINVDSYDAGTDSGLTFLSPNEVTDPFEPISKITTQPLAIDGVVRPLGQLIFTRIID